MPSLVGVDVSSGPSVDVVDWGQARVILRGEPVEVHVFLMRACHSGASFAVAFRAETQQAFLEGHVRAFEWFAGVFEVVRYHNLRSAVVRVLKGRRRVESDRFVALRSYYMFESVFCLAGKRGAHEKGGVEGEVGRFRRRHLVPVPKVASMAELNEPMVDAARSELHAAGIDEQSGVVLAVTTMTEAEVLDVRATSLPRGVSGHRARLLPCSSTGPL